MVLTGVRRRAAGFASARDFWRFAIVACIQRTLPGERKRTPKCKASVHSAPPNPRCTRRGPHTSAHVRSVIGTPVLWLASRSMVDRATPAIEQHPRKRPGRKVTDAVHLVRQIFQSSPCTCVLQRPILTSDIWKLPVPTALLKRPARFNRAGHTTIPQAAQAHLAS